MKNPPKPKPLPTDPVEDVTRVDVTALDNDFTQLPAQIAHTTERYAAALGRLMRAETHRKQVEAELFLEFKKTPLEGGKYPSEEICKAMVRQHPRFHSAQEQEIDTEVARVRLHGLVEALRAKRDALVSLGAGQRLDKQGEVNLRDPEHPNNRSR